MGKWEELEEKLDGWIARSDQGTLKHIRGWMAELDAAEAKERPDSEGWWWHIDMDQPSYWDKNGIPDRTVPANGIYIKIDKPTFPEPEKEPLINLEDSPASTKNLEEIKTRDRPRVHSQAWDRPVTVEERLSLMSYSLMKLERRFEGRDHQLTDIEMRLNELDGQGVYEHEPDEEPSPMAVPTRKIVKTMRTVQEVRDWCEKKAEEQRGSECPNYYRLESYKEVIRFIDEGVEEPEPKSHESLEVIKNYIHESNNIGVAPHVTDIAASVELDQKFVFELLENRSDLFYQIQEEDDAGWHLTLKAAEEMAPNVAAAPPEPEISDEPPPIFGKFPSVSQPYWYSCGDKGLPWDRFEILFNPYQDMKQARKWLEEARK